ncbi:hypothetical protein [Streptomyces sp. NPDC055056]
MSQQTPSQAEGERPDASSDENEEPAQREVSRPTPSQAEGEDTEAD